MAELREVMGTDDSLNNHKLSKNLVAALNGVFADGLYSQHATALERWFVVWDEYATEKLSKLIPVVTEGMPCYWIGGNAYLVWFDWSIQKFIVSV